MPREITFSQAIREAMSEEMRHDPSVFLIGEDLGIFGGAFGVTRGMLDEFGPERIIDTPISEAGIVGGAIGAAMGGMRPIAEIMFSDFVTIAMDQLVNQGAKVRFMFGGHGTVPMVLRLPEGSGYGAAAQHSQSLSSWFLHVPGLKVVTPSTPYDAKGLMKSAIRDDNIVLFFEHKMLYNTKGPVPEEDYSIPLGVADVKREGKDVTIVAVSIMVQRALAAAEKLAKEGIEAEVIDPRTLLPYDEETVNQSVMKTGRVLIVHEAVTNGGMGGEFASRIAGGPAFGYLDAPIKRLGGKFIPIPYNPNLEKAAVPQETDIIQAVHELLV